MDLPKTSSKGFTLNNNFIKNAIMQTILNPLSGKN